MSELEKVNSLKELEEEFTTFNFGLSSSVSVRWIILFGYSLFSFSLSLLLSLFLLNTVNKSECTKHALAMNVSSWNVAFLIAFLSVWLPS